jgi:FkbM family methyltransferase
MSIFRHVDHVRGHAVWLPGLGRESVVVDAGAHKGEFSRSLAERFGCRCYLVEANPDLAAQLSQQGFKNVLPAALSAEDGRARFVHRDNKESGGIVAGEGETGATTVEVETLSLPALLRRVGAERIDLLKLDIEGAEFDLIAKTPDEVLRGIGQITVECHDFLPEFKGRGLYEALRDRLEALGFICCCMSIRTHGDVLFLNQSVAGLGAFNRFQLRHIARWEARLRVNIPIKNRPPR